MRHASVRFALAVACLGSVSSLPVVASATVYPSNLCVSTKLHAAANYCGDYLKAWGTWDHTQDGPTRDAKLALAAAKLSDKWSQADAKALTKGVLCAETTLSAADTKLLMDPVLDAIVNQVNTGLDLGQDAHGTCGRKLLIDASVTCRKVVLAESLFVKQLAIDSDGAKRTARKAKASTIFNTKWTAATAGDCPTGGTAGGVESTITGLNDDVVYNSSNSPSVSNATFATIPGQPTTYEGRAYDPICQRGGDYNFFVKRGTVNKLMMYYQGGGACWDYFTCEVAHTSDETVDVAGGDNPNNGSHVGLDDQTNPNNPFKDWNIVFVPYCSGDVHLGDAPADYTDGTNTVHIEHRGFANAKVAEKWAREHFVNPEQIFVTGSSAGGYGALLHGAWLQRVYPASDFNVLADAANGVITEDFRTTNFPSWGVDDNLPPNLPALTTLTVPETTALAANTYPRSKWAHYTTAFDGGTGGQTGFYNVMLNPGDVGQWLNWWNASCAWNSVMRTQVQTTFSNVTTDNYRYYIGTGSRHTMFGSSRVYSSTTGGVPTIVDWINAMLTDSPSWTNVEAANEGLLLSGDVRPSPLQAPFQQVGPDVVVTCP